MALTTGAFLKQLGLDAVLKGGDITDSLNALKSEMVSGMAAQKPAEEKPSKKTKSEVTEPEVIDTDGEEVKDASDFARKYGRAR